MKSFRLSSLIKIFFIILVLAVPGVASAEVSPVLGDGVSACSEEAEALRSALNSLEATGSSVKEDLEGIHECFNWLLETLKDDRSLAKYARIELDVRLVALKSQDERYEAPVKALHELIARFMKCHGIKPPSNGKKAS